MEKTDIIHVAYLSGTSHCGSTLMAMLMNSHPRIVSVGETSIHHAARTPEYPCSCGETLIKCEFWQQVFFSIKQQGFEFDIINWPNDYRYKNALINKILTYYSHNNFFQKLQRMANYSLPIHNSRIKKANVANVAFIRSITKLSHAEIFFDATKSIMRLYHLLNIKDIDVKVVRMIRDVRAFVYSSKRNRNLPIEKSARIWKRYQLALDSLLDTIPAKKVFLLRYEDLCQNPQFWIGRLHNFLDIEIFNIPTTIKTENHHIIGNRMRLNKVLSVELEEIWRYTLNDKEVSQILNIAGEINKRFGYMY